ncbi:MAG: adenosylmethionine--8-amino-7-oxononanoate transaminase [Clostridium sp.]|uniref:adenosylmethionine--8-amino-7-oxononanoate transaminase n=1 Tax=Clostridium sp. TaxID=1506 RepID=UPI002FC9B8ED
MNLVDKDLEYIWHPCSQMKDYEDLKPIIVDRGKGVYLYDIEGNSYIDIVSSWWCNLLGHSNEIINEAVKNQLDNLEHVIFANFSNKPVINLCTRLQKYMPKGLCKYFFTDNGSAAVEVAMKMSFQYHAQNGNERKTRFMALEDGYHGETLGALSAGGVDLYSKIYKPLLLDVIRTPAPDCYRCKYNKSRNSCSAECFVEAEDIIRENADMVSGFLVEPLLQGAAGMRIYPPVYLKKLSEACRRYNIHLIVDEIATGFYRTGRMFAADYAGITPDFMCLSKGLTGGYMPMAITITTNEIYNGFYDDYNKHRAFMHSHTYSGNPLAAAAANAVLDILEEGSLVESLKDKGEYINALISREFKDNKYVGEIRSIGLINAIEIVKDKDSKEGFNSDIRLGYQIYKEALSKGLLLRPLGNIIYFNPPLTITYEEIEKSIKICVEAFNIIDEIVNK